MAMSVISTKFYEVSMTTLSSQGVDKQKTGLSLLSHCLSGCAVPKATCLIRKALDRQGRKLNFITAQVTKVIEFSQ